MAMDKKKTITVLLFILFAVALIGGLVQNGYCQDAKPIKLTYALFQPGTAALSKMNTEFAKEIEKRTMDF